MVFELVGSRTAEKEKGREKRERVVAEIEHGGKERGTDR